MGIGVKGVSSATTGATYGVMGSIASSVSDAAGVYGHATAATGTAKGVFGVAESDGGSGVYGLAINADGIGVFGLATSSSGCGVYGENEGSGLALFSYGQAHVQGNLAVTGTLSKGGGSFKIDHPLDPANKFLYHSFVESPDMKNVYDGAVTLNAQGEATVTLPDWFDALNRDTRIQLTAVGEAAPDLHVKSKVKGNAFSIAGGKSDQEVYWQLTGIRRDAWANAHRIPVEEEKPKSDRGLYLHPAENGQPPAKGLHEVKHAAMKTVRE